MSTQARTTRAATPTAFEIEEWSTAHIAKVMGIAPAKIIPTADIDSLGLDSASAVAFVMSLEEWLGIELMPEILFDYPSIRELSGHLAKSATNES